eukprot:Nitzschia sp. Nitz4//scaffold42_size132992//6245//7597//NITZ4_003378-RA/size132992-processed-gene-0.2-mRNA-1//1//CDS//3329551655//9269//frame0
MTTKRPWQDQGDTNNGKSNADDTIKEYFESFGQNETVEIPRKLGNPNVTRGTFGEITVGVRSGTQSPWLVAIKALEQAIVSFSDDTNKEDHFQLSKDVRNEVVALQYLGSTKHPNIVPLLAMYPSKQPPRALKLVFPYASIDIQLSLEWRCRQCLPPLDFPVIATILRSTMAALSHCHRLGVLHRDVKPGNLLVAAEGTIQLCDFGLARPFLPAIDQAMSNADLNIPAFHPSQGGTKGLCTLHYRPPEVLLGGPSNQPSVDMYSAGMVLAFLLQGSALVPGNNVLDQLARIFALWGTPTDDHWPQARALPDFAKFHFVPKPRDDQLWPWLLPRVTESPCLVAILDSLVALDPSLRCSADQAMEQLAKDEKLSTDCSPLTLQHALVPPELQLPPVLDPTHSRLIQQAGLHVAEQRRNCLRSEAYSAWKGVNSKEGDSFALTADLAFPAKAN